MDTKLIVSASPHVRSDETTQSLMANVIVALCPCVVASAIIFGVRALLVTTAQRLAWLRHLPQDRRWGRDLQRARAAYDLLNPSSHAAATP